jgi:hypothetical protein
MEQETNKPETQVKVPKVDKKALEEAKKAKQKMINNNQIVTK